MAEKEPNHQFINKKLQNLVELASDTSVITSKQAHQINDIQTDVDKIKKDLNGLSIRQINEIRKLEVTMARIEESLKNIKTGMDKVEKKFTWAKIGSILITLITVSGGFLATMLVILKNLGILK
jgi:paraquat-inducible protein B